MSFNFNLQSQSRGVFSNSTLQMSTRERDQWLRFENQEITLQIQQAIAAKLTHLQIFFQNDLFSKTISLFTVGHRVMEAETDFFWNVKWLVEKWISTRKRMFWRKSERCEIFNTQELCPMAFFAHRSTCAYLPLLGICNNIWIHTYLRPLTVDSVGISCH